MRVNLKDLKVIDAKDVPTGQRAEWKKVLEDLPVGKAIVFPKASTDAQSINSIVGSFRRKLGMNLSVRSDEYNIYVLKNAKKEEQK